MSTLSNILWLLKKFSSFTTQSLNLRHHCYNRGRCRGRKKSSQQSGSVLPVETHKARFRCGGVGILCICAYKKVYGNSASHVWMWPANCILHLTQLLAGRVVHVDIGCAAGASSSIWWDNKQILCVGGFVTWKYHQHHLLTHSMICKNICYLNTL